MTSKPTLKGRSMVPFGGQYVLNDPEKGMVGSASNFDQLVDFIAAYRRANAIPIGLGFKEEIEAAICVKYPGECRESNPLLPDPTQRLNWRDIVRGTIVMVKQKVGNITGKTPLVTDEEAERRAKICVPCKFNQDITYGCTGGCPELNTVIAAIVGAKRTSVDDRLRGCAICHCSLRSAVYVDVELQRSVLNDKQKEQFKVAKQLHGCWKAPE